MTISELLADFYSLANASPDDDLAASIRAINHACEAIERAKLSAGKQIISCSYTGGATSVAFTTLVTAQQLTQIDNVSSSNAIIRIVDYNSFKEEQRKYELRRAGDGEANSTMPIVSQSDLYATCVGMNLLLYPTPTTSTTLSLTARVKLPYFISTNVNYAATGGDVTNYLLTYYPSLVLARALVEYAVYRKWFTLYEGYNKDYQSKLTEVLSEDGATLPDKLTTT